MDLKSLLGVSALSALGVAWPHAAVAQQTSRPSQPLLAPGARAAVPAPSKPDIVFLLVDDLGYSDVSWHGGKFKTPHIDQIAQSGARLEQFYVQPLCTPTRAGLLTGRYPMRYGLQVSTVRPWDTYGLPLQERTLPQALREAGYTTAMCGKWHLGSFEPAYWPNERGFDYSYGHLQGAIDYFEHTRDGKPDWFRNGKPIVEEGYSTTLIGKDAAGVIRRQPKAKPLFLYVPFNGVHGPLQVPDSYVEPYRQLARPRRQKIGGMFVAVDESVGEILKALDETGRRKNTLIVFASDNGGPVAGDNAPLHGKKNTIYEGGTRSSGVVVWPGHVKAGDTINEMLHIVDFYPTFLSVAGASTDAQHQKLPLDGRNILPTLTQGQPSPHQELLLNSAPLNGALRFGDWKIVVHKENRELYNLRQDPNESTDLAATQPLKLKELSSRYDAYARQAVAPKSPEPEAAED